MRILTHTNENVRTLAAYGIVGAYTYTIASAALGAVAETYVELNRKDYRPLLVLKPVEGALLGMYLGWTHPIKFVKGCWAMIRDKDL